MKWKPLEAKTESLRITNLSDTDYNSDNEKEFNNKNTELDDHIKILKEHSAKIKEDYPIFKEGLLYEEDDEETIKNHINILKSKWLDFIGILEKNSFFEKEFLKILSLELIFEYIIDDKNLFEKHHSLIYEMMVLYFGIFDFKIENKDKENFNEIYREKYEKFVLKIYDKENFFYTEICQPSENYDKDTLDYITGLLVR